MLDVSGRGSQRARLIVPLDSVPPNTVPPSPDKTTLPIQAKPPNTSSPHQTRRAIRLREGDSTPGGWFCRRRVILPNPTSSFNQPPNHSTLPIQYRPPNPGKTTKNQPSPPNPEGDSVAGGRFCTRRVTLSPEGTSTKPHQQF